MSAILLVITWLSLCTRLNVFCDNVKNFAHACMHGMYGSVDKYVVCTVLVVVSSFGSSYEMAHLVGLYPVQLMLCACMSVWVVATVCC